MFKFTIRDLLWLTVVVALGVGWWLTYRELAAARAFLANLVEVDERPWYLGSARVWVEKAPQEITLPNPSATSSNPHKK